MSNASHRFTSLRALLAGMALFLSIQAGTANATDGPKSAFIQDMLGQLERVKGQIVSLESAIPQDKANWRPADGVRSISEVYLHIAGSNYFLMSFTGSKLPASSKIDEKGTTDKAKIADALKASFDWTKEEVSKLTDADLDKQVAFFGGKSSVRNVLFVLLSHLHEHLGQSIAYARSNGVVPPWSEEQQAALKDAMKKK
ncbi:MAG: DinB family protein [Ignavibacteriales bacterium]|nr:DinB family protein [Ignavibacteriales bacterium]